MGNQIMSYFSDFGYSNYDKLLYFINTDNFYQLKKELELNPKGTCSVENEIGVTLLMFAVFHGNINIILAFLNYGADVTKIDRLGKRA